jgi:hypothetical protein
MRQRARRNAGQARCAVVVAGAYHDVVGCNADLAGDALAHRIHVAHLDQVERDQGDAAAAVIEHERAQIDGIVHALERAPHRIQGGQVRRRDLHPGSAGAERPGLGGARDQEQPKQAGRLEKGWHIHFLPIGA